MIVLVPDESHAGERRVAATPETVKKLVEEGLEVRVEAGAGARAFFPDEEFVRVGARVEGAAEGPWREADLVLRASPLGRNPAFGADDVELIKEGAVVVGLLAPFRDLGLVQRLAERRVTSLPLELVPRVTRAQSMDALSSQANIAGYKAVLLAASRLGRYFPLLMTAAGTIRPARVVIMGAGVAGLQALATARRLGAVVEVSDIRPAVKEQVASLGGRFIDLPELEGGEDEGGYAKEMGEDFLRRQREIVGQHLAAADVVVTTAQVPGKQAPRLISREMVESMRPGAIIVDLAAEQGGNCELTRPGEEVEHRGVLVLGPPDLAAATSQDASTLLARNILEFVREMLSDGELRIDPDSEIVGATLLTHQGRVVHASVAARLGEAVA